VIAPSLRAWHLEVKITGLSDNYDLKIGDPMSWKALARKEKNPHCHKCKVHDLNLQSFISNGDAQI
jgi:hypothetical protein